MRVDLGIIKRFSISLMFLVGATNTVMAQTQEQAYFDWTTMPFTIEELQIRRAKLYEILNKQGKKGMVLIPSADGLSHGETFRQLDDFYYFTGLELPNSLLVINLQNGSAEIHTPARDLRFENGSRKNDFPGRPLLGDQQISDLSGLPLVSFDSLEVRLQRYAKSEGTILVNCGLPGPVPNLSQSYIGIHSPIPILIAALRAKHKNLAFENIYGSVAAIRMIKSPAEIELIKKAVTITIKGIKDAAGAIENGMTERFLEGVLEGTFKMQGSQRLAFASIIKSGPNALWPWRILATHYDRRNRAMQDGDLVIFDVGCEYNHYVSDVGRTFPVSGTFTSRQREILKMETNVADQIIAFIRPGITFNDIKVLTDSIIPPSAKKYMQVGLFFGHHLGLSTGDPNVSNATLQPGMVFTVEPWYYNHDEEISVFTEDVILVTADGAAILSNDLPRTPEGLESMVKK